MVEPPSDHGQEIIHMFECIDRQDWTQLSRCFHDDVVYERPGYQPFVGKPAVMEFYRQERIIAKGEHAINNVLSDGRHVACWGQFKGEAKDGRPLSVGFSDVYQVAGGLILFRRTFFDAVAV